MSAFTGDPVPGKTSSVKDQDHYFKNLFLHSPTPTWVEDFSSVKRLFDRAREAGIRDFRPYFEAHPDEVKRCADLVKIVEVNRSSLEFFQARSISDIPTNLSAFFRDDSWPVFHEEMIALANGSLRFESKIPIYDLSGNRRIVNLTLTVLPESAATLSCVLISFLDITERERLDEALRESEERFRILLRDIPSISVQGYDAHGNVTYWNEASTTLYGYSKEEAMGRHLTDLIIPPAMRTAVQGTIKNMVETLQPIPSSPLDLIRKDGSTVTVFSSHTVMHIPGRGFELYCLDIDLTELKQAEHRLQDQLQELRRWHEITLGREMRILDLKREVNELLLKADRPPRYASAEMPNQSLITERKTETPSFLEPTEQSRETLLSLVEDQKQTETALLHEKSMSVTLQQQLQQAAKMDAIGRLAGGVAHDFNNLLQAILGFSDVLISQSDPKDSRLGDLLEIKKAGIRAADLTRQLLAFGRKQMIEPRVLNLNPIVAGAEPMLRRLLGEDITIHFLSTPDVRHITADPGQIEQIIMNLAVNARDAMPNGGRLTLSTTNVTMQEVDTKLCPEAQPGNYVCLSVSDTGTGMSTEVLEHLFEPFFTTKELGKGTGLGLAVIYGIVKQNNGWLNVYSQVGQGSTFRIYFPIHDNTADEPIEPFQDHSSLPLAPRGKGERILLIEDEPSVRNLATTVLRRHGYEVLPGASALEAQDLFNLVKGQIDLLFSDVVLPGKTGIELADQLLALKPGLNVLLSSGYADERARWSIIEDRGYHFLQKPYPVASLLRTVHHILASK